MTCEVMGEAVDKVSQVSEVLVSPPPAQPPIHPLDAQRLRGLGRKNDGGLRDTSIHMHDVESAEGGRC